MKSLNDLFAYLAEWVLTEVCMKHFSTILRKLTLGVTRVCKCCNGSITGTFAGIQLPIKYQDQMILFPCASNFIIHIGLPRIKIYLPDSNMKRALGH